MGTIGGVMAHADPAGDYGALALMLDARSPPTSGTIAARDFFGAVHDAAGGGRAGHRGSFPVATGRPAYVKFRRRMSDWAIVGVAAQETGTSWRVGYVNLARTPRRGAAVEQALAGGASAADAAAQCGVRHRSDR